MYQQSVIVNNVGGVLSTLASLGQYFLWSAIYLVFSWPVPLVKFYLPWLFMVSAYGEMLSTLAFHGHSNEVQSISTFHGQCFW